MAEAAVPVGGVVGLDVLIIPPTTSKPAPAIAFEAVAPTAEHAARRQLAILAEPANPGGGLAKAYVSGFFPALVNFDTANGQYAAVSVGTSDSMVAKNAGEFIILWRANGTDTGEQWCIVTPAPRDQMFRVKVTANASGGGKYNAKLFKPRTTAPTASGNMAESDIGVLATDVDCLFHNLEETGASTHVLTEGSQTPIAMGTFSGLTSGGIVCVTGLSLASEECTVPE